jgi:hypothetical protein
MATQAFIDSVVKEIIHPGVERLMALPYFTELRAGKLSIKRLQGLGAATLFTQRRAAQRLRSLHGQEQP